MALPEQRGVEGHLRVKGAAVIERYFGDDKSATDPNGWFATGDLAKIEPGIRELGLGEIRYISPDGKLIERSGAAGGN